MRRLKKVLIFNIHLIMPNRNESSGHNRAATKARWRRGRVRAVEPLLSAFNRTPGAYGTAIKLARRHVRSTILRNSHEHRFYNWIFEEAQCLKQSKILESYRDAAAWAANFSDVPNISLEINILL